MLRAVFFGAILMAAAIKMPDLGTTVEQITVLKWLKKEGEAVKRGDPLCEIQTDKAVTELESVAQGVLLKQIVAENTDVAVGDVIAYIGTVGEAAP
jgi:pyruvate/2-oxoglutarate dehydrogenase complex dihydrolipoamide acyltransferase (E2) component